MKNQNPEKSSVSLTVKVTPRASKNALVGWEEGVLKVRLKATPQQGEANEMLIEFLSEVLEIPKSWIELVRGHTSRHKQLRITGISAAQLTTKILRML